MEVDSELICVAETVEGAIVVNSGGTVASVESSEVESAEWVVDSPD